MQVFSTPVLVLLCCETDLRYKVQRGKKQKVLRMQTVHHHAWLSNTANKNKEYPVPAIIQAVYCTSKFMGAAPYTISSSGVVSYSRKWLWFSRFFHVFLAVLSLLQVVYYEVRVGQAPTGISRILFIFNSGVYGARCIGIHCCILVLLHSRLKKLINYWRENSETPRRDKRKVLIYVQWISLIVFCWFLMFLLNSFYVTAENGKGSFQVVAEIFAQTMNEMSVLMVEIQFTCCILVLGKQFMYINDQLSQQIELLNSGEEVFMTGDSRLPPDKQLTNKWWMLSTGNKHRAFQNNCSVAALRSHHAFLVGVSEDVNNLYTVPILAYIMHCTTHAIVSCFAVISETPNYLNRASWTSVYLTRLVIVMLACHNTSSQADHTAKLVHEALNEETLTMEERKELKVFSQQLVHRKCAFHIYEFFTIDLQLIPKMLSVVTSYLVIMMQFQLTLSPQQA